MGVDTLKVILFIPCFNVEHSILKVIESLKSVENKFYKIYFIDNGSTDQTRHLLKTELAKKQKANWRLFFNENNYTLGGSTILAFRLAIEDGADFLICMHSDGQARTSDLLHFFPFSKTEDFVIGSRLLRRSDVVHYSALRRLANQFFVFLQKMIIKQDVRDLGAFLAFNLKTIAQLPYDRIEANMAYHPSLILYAFSKMKNLRVREFPIYWGKVETTNINVVSYGLSHLLRLFKFYFNIYKLSGRSIKDFTTEEIW